MKKLELNQMENLEGLGSGRKCFLYGVGAGISASIAILNPVAAWSQFWGGGALAGFYGAVSDNCF